MLLLNSRLVIVVALLLTLVKLMPVNASSAAARVEKEEAPQSAPLGECHSRGEEGRVLCEASRRKDDSIKQVIEEDDTVNDDPESSVPSADRAGDVWSTAYKQWVEGNGPDNGQKGAEGVARALDEARKRLGGDTDMKRNGNQSASLEMPNEQDDELVRVTKAVHLLADTTLLRDAVLAALDTVDMLCSSGDNGRQMHAAGGIPHLLRHAHDEETEVAVMAVRSLATCAQNNPPVFEAAVKEHGAIEILLNVAREGVLELRAAAMRAVVAVSGASSAESKFTKHKDVFLRVIVDSLRMEDQGKDGKRCVTRAYALVEQCLIVAPTTWKKAFLENGLIQTADAALKSDDVDVREGAARALTFLR